VPTPSVSETVENYLKAIFSEEAPNHGIDLGCTITRLAALVGVTKGSATTMVKKLAAGKLVKYERYGLVTLTTSGRHLAIDVLRRHRIVEQFLVQIVGLDWSEVHAEAERLEHAISPTLLDKLDAMLGPSPVPPFRQTPLPIPSPRAPASPPLSRP
jgi:DtxR family transcriptional regulator, Mn-dependent transcriptional regulator